MKEVSCRAVALILRHLEGLGEEQRALDGIPYTLAHLHDKDERIEWTVFVRLMRNTRTVLADEDYLTIGGSLPRSPLFRVFGTFSRVLFTLSGLYRWVATPSSGGGNQMFTCVQPSFEQIGPGHSRVKLEVAAGYDLCSEFYAMSEGTFRDLPLMMSRKPATIRFTQVGQAAIYDIFYTPTQSLFGWLKRVLLTPLSMRNAAIELKEAHETLQSRYFELNSTKLLVAAQKTQLETAYAISQVVHAEPELSSTLEAVARAFVDIAHFTGAHVLLGGPPLREAWAGAFGETPDLVRTFAARGDVFGEIRLWTGSGIGPEPTALLDVVAPTVTMALDGARAYALVLDAQQNLERRVQLRTQELTAARDALAESVGQLEASEKARSRLFANINHELRTPLTLIMLSVEEMRRADGMTPAQDRTLVSIGRNARKLLRLVDGLLMLAAGDEKRINIAPRDLDVSAAAGEVLDAFAASAKDCGVVLRVECPPNVRAEVDELALDRILSNLVSNALKFTPAGGEIVVSCHDIGDEIMFDVRDTGIGLTDGFMSRIFGRFEQDNRPVRPGTAGSGIGLSLVRDLSEAHHGRVEVERLDKGTRFRVLLPKTAAADLRRATSERPRLRRSTPSDFGLPTGLPAVVVPASARRESTVLVIEDDDELRARLVTILSERYHVLPAADGESGLALAEAQRPDMLVSDIGLPGMDGLEVARRYRALPGNRLSPVLLLTAYAAVEARLQGFDAGAVDYVTKPFDPQELIARVHAQLERRRLALQLHESEKLAALGTMTAGLAHEMRNPANALVNAVEPLIELLPAEVKNSDNGVSDLLSVVRDAAAQIGLLSRQLLGFRRGVEIEREAADGALLVERAIGILRPALRNVELQLDMRFKGPVSCAPALVLQVLGNLLDNAAHAATRSAAPGSKGWVRVSTFAEDGRFVVLVSDSGPGVPVALRDRIFDAFFTTKPPGEGTGLGLSTSRQIAERHQGSLFVAKSDTVSTFRLELPLSVPKSENVVAVG